MSSSNIFFIQIYKFLNSITIKNSYFADMSKKKYAEYTFRDIDSIESTEIPYYINLIGEYSLFDTVMEIDNIEDGSTIAFTKENLSLFPKTRHAYSIGTEFYNQLITRYPTQVDLIKNILYPVSDIESAYNADSFTLLQYDETLLETHEAISIVEAISEHLHMFKVRWDVKEFDYEEYYPITQWTLLWSSLYFIIVAQRIKNLKTEKAHTSHIWDYLTSNGLGDYRSILNREQELFLYKNIQYLIANRGKDSNLSILTEHLLKPHHITLKSKSVVLNTEDGFETAIPTAEIISKDIRDNRTPSQSIRHGFETIAKVFERAHEDGLEPVLSNEVISQQTKLLSSMRQSYLPTKLVELSKIDIYAESHQHYVNFAIETILYKQSLDELNYNILVNFTDTDISMSLTPDECIALIYYCIAREFDTVPDDLLIPKEAVLTQCFKDEFPEIVHEFTYRDMKYRIGNILNVDKMMNRIPSSVGSITSPDELLQMIDTQFHYMYLDHSIMRTKGDMSYHLAFDRLYKQLKFSDNVYINTAIPYITYSDWFDNDTTLYNFVTTMDNSASVKEAYARAGNNIILALVPVNDSLETTFSKFTFSDYLLMKKLFIQLCSYNIAFLDTDRSDELYHRFAPIVLNDLSTFNYTGDVQSPNEIHPIIKEDVEQTSIIEFKMGLHSTQHIGNISDLSNNIESEISEHVLNDVTHPIYVDEKSSVEITDDH